MIVGMGTVFAFLALLVVLMTATGYVMQTWFPEPLNTTLQDQGKGDSRRQAAVAAAVAWNLRQGE